MRKWVILMMMVLMICFTGCGKKPRGSGSMVTQITVSEEGQQRIYTDSEKMGRILNQLRTLGQRYTPDMEITEDADCSMTLQYADGSSRRYDLKGNRYIRTGQGAWKETVTDGVRRLRLLLKTLPGDPLKTSNR